MNKNTRFYYESALKLLLPAIEVPEVDGFKLRLGKKNYFFCGRIYPLNNRGSHHVAANKYSMNKILSHAGFPLPNAVVIDCAKYEENQLETQIEGLQFPLVAKPQLGSRGKDVLCNIKKLPQLQQYMKQHKDAYEFITIEEFHGGLNSYRVLVFKEKVIALVQRFPARITGDGIHTLQELINLSNAKREHDTLKPIVVDEECQIRLEELGLELNDIIPKNKMISLNYTCNASRGGTYASLKNQMCAENRALLINAARELNLEMVGFDVECQDINIPIASSGGVIIEANNDPSIRIHEIPMEGERVEVSKMVMKSLIFKHPFAYLHILYQNRKSARYLRFTLLAFIMTIVYCTIRT